MSFRRGGRAIGKATWVCFDCRQVMRRPILHAGPMPCPRCGQPGRSLGTQARVPARTEDRAWRTLRESFRERRLAEVDRLARWRVAERHHVERRLAELEARPTDGRREAAIRRLRERLEALSP
jgi:hypothetical protein